LEGILKVQHFAPMTRADPVGSFCVIFLAKQIEPVELMRDNLVWCDPQDFTEESEAHLLKEYLSGKGILVPLEILTYENAPCDE